MRSQPGWPTVVAVACIVAVLFLALWQSKQADRLATEAAWRQTMNGRMVRLLTLLEHAPCEDVEGLREAVAEMRQEIDGDKR